MSHFLQRIRLHRQQYLAGLDIHPFPDQAVAKILRYGAPVGALIEHHKKLCRGMDRLQLLMGEAERRGEALAGGTVVMADELSGSCGRFDRHWHAPEGGVWLAMAWPDILLPEFSRFLPFAAGLAACRTIRSYLSAAWLKWVNDILVEGKKIGGVLCETVLSKGGDRYHLLGIGLNVNNRAFPDNLQVNATSLAGEMGGDIDLAEFAGRLLSELTWSLGLLHYDEEQALLEQQTLKQIRLLILFPVLKSLEV